MTSVAKCALQLDGNVEINGNLILDGTLDTNSTITFDGAVDFDAGVDLAGATVTYPAAQINPAALASTAVSPAANAACAILNTTTEINLTVTDGTNTAISTTSSVAGQKVYLIAASVAGGGSYTLALVSGTLTLNSTGETALIVRNAANSGWRALALTAGVAGGAAATVV